MYRDPGYIGRHRELLKQRSGDTENGRHREQET
jgi:hypothetical protein